MTSEAHLDPILPGWSGHVSKHVKRMSRVTLDDSADANLGAEVASTDR